MLELSSQTYGLEEMDAISRVLLSGRVTMGEETLAFEKEFADYIGTEHAIMVNSGSSANLLIVASLIATKTLRPGDHVIAPALSWSTTVWPLLQHGLKVSLADCDMTLQTDPKILEALLPAKAVFAANILGNPCNMTALQAFCNAHNCLLLEDSCETLGATYRGFRTGRFGYMSSFSFYFSHHITTVEGGMVVTNDPMQANHARAMRSHGWARAFGGIERSLFEAENPTIDPRFLFVTEGYNLRPTEMQAAMGRVQLGKLPAFAQRRADVHSAMVKIVCDYPELCLPVSIPYAFPSWFAFPVICMGDRDRFSAYLERNGIQTRPIIAGSLGKHPAFRDRVLPTSTPCANMIMKQGLYWGLHPNVTEEQLDHLAKVLAAYDWRAAA